MIRKQIGFGMAMFLSCVAGILLMGALTGAYLFWAETAIRGHWMALAAAICCGVAAAGSGTFFFAFRIEGTRARCESDFQTVLDKLPLFFCRFRPDGVLTYVNDAYCRYFGLSGDELVGRNFFALVPEEARETIRCRYQSLTPESPAKTYEHQMFAPEEVRWQRWTNRAIFDGGAVVEYHSFGEDITEQKQSEESLRASEDKFSRAFRLNPSMLVIVDGSTRLTLEVNESFTRFTGYSADEVVGRTVDMFDLIFAREIRMALWQEAATHGRSERQELRYRCKSGEERTALCMVETLGMQNRGVLLITVTDITALKQTREALLESERRHGTLMDNLPGITYRCRNDESWTFEYVNEGSLALTGYEPLDLIGNRVISYIDLIDPEDRDMVREKVDEAVAEHQPYVLEYRIVTRDGARRWVWEKGAAVYGKNGETCVLEGFITDITERKRADDAMRASEDKFSRAFHQNPSMLIIVDGNTRVTLEVNESFTRITGYSADKVVGHTVDAFDDIFDRNIRIDLWEQTRERGKSRDQEIRFRCTSGEERIALCSVDLLGMRNRGIVLITATDVTALRQTREALLESERRHGSLMDNLPGIAFRCRNDAACTFEYVSEGALALTGYEPPDLIGNRVVSFLDLIDPEDRDMVLEKVGGAIVEHRPYMLEYRIVTRDGSRRWVWVKGAAVYGENGEVVSVEGFITDITERKRTDDAMRISEEKFARTFRMSPNAIAILDRESRKVIEVNEQFVRCIGYTPEEMTGQTLEDRWIWGNQGERVAIWSIVLDQGRVFDAEIHFRRKNGDMRYGLLSIESLDLPGREALLFVVSDITALHEAREALRASERKYRMLFEGMDNALANHRIITDDNWIPIDYVFLEVNETFARFTGLPPEEISGKRMSELYPDLKDDAFDWVGVYGKVALTGEPVRFEQYSPSFDRWISVSVNSPAPGEFLTNFYDVSDRKAAETERERYASLLRATLEATEDGIMVLDLDQKITVYNQRIIDLWRVPDSLLSQEGDARILPAVKDQVDDPDAFMAMEEAYLDDPEREGVDTLMFRDGRVYEQYTRPQRLGDNIVGRVWSFRDVTPRVIVEQSLRESEEKYRTLFECMNDGSAEYLLVTDEESNPVDFICLDMNREFERLLDIRREDVVGLGYFEYYAGREENPGWLEMYGKVALTGEPARFEMYSMIVDKWFAVSAYSPAPGLFVSALHDITARKHAEDALKANEALLSTMLDSLPVGVWLIDPSMDSARSNPAALRIWGYSGWITREQAEEKKNGWWVDSGKPLALEEWAGWRAVMEGETTLNEEIEIECADGTHKIILNSGVPLRNEQGEIIGGITVNEDITERKRAEEALREEKERLAVTLRSIGDGVITTDRDGTVVLLNRVAEELTGWSQAEAQGRAFEEVFHILNEETREECESPYRKIIDTGGVVELSNHTILVARDGREIVLADSGAPILDRHSRIIGVVLVFRDVTEKKRLEYELQKMDKLESVGVLAGGIAHDFNNILTGLLGALSLAGSLLEGEPDVTELIREAEKQSLRARDLTGQLLTFSKGGMPVRITASIVETVRETTLFMLRGSRVRAVFSLPDDLWAARVDLNQLTQVVNNLVLNAIQAMPDGGRIEVEARNTVIEDQKLPLAPGGYIMLSVRDHGTGIARENLPRVFDPYFTTKRMGSGLGLATTYSIVKRHDGHIEVESEVGEGTVFRIYLPAVPGQRGATEAAVPFGSLPDIRSLSGQGRILVMDDDEGVRGMAVAMLQTLGYTVQTASNGEIALELYREAQETGVSFDAVIMDLTIPDGMGGKDAIAAMREYDPAVCAIVSSGYSTDPIMAECGKYGFRGVLMKPYRLEEISRTLREAIGEQGKE